MRSLRQERSRLLDVLVSVTAGLIILFAINVRAIWTWARARETSLTGRARVTSSAVVRGAVGMLDRWLTALELHAYDQRLALRAQFNPRRDDPRAAEKLIFVEVDDDALARHGRWPWPRELQADLIAALKRLGCRGVLTDVEYPEPALAQAGGPSPDTLLARALAQPSEGRPSRFGLPDGAAFGVTALGLSGTPDERRATHVRRRLYAWAVQAGDAPHLPDRLRAELTATGEANPDAAAARAVALAGLLRAQPMANRVDVLLAGVLPDLEPPPVPRELEPDAPQHIALVLQSCMSAVQADPQADEATLVERTLEGVQVQIHHNYNHSWRTLRYATRYLPALVAFCRTRREALRLLDETLDEVRMVLFEQWIGEEKKRDPRVDGDALTRAIATRLKMPAAERHLLAERVQQRRAARNLLWGRDLHAAPEGGLIDRLPVLGDLSTPIPELAAAYRGIGISTVERDEGGEVRQQRLTFRVEGAPGDPDGDRPRLAFHASVPVVAYLRGLDLDRAQAGEDFLRLPSKYGGADLVVPIDALGRAIIDFRGRWRDDGFERVSAAQVLLLASRWRLREELMRTEPDYRANAAKVEALGRFQFPRGRLPIPGEALFQPALALVADTLVAALSRGPRAELDVLARDLQLKLALEVRDLLDAIAEARKSGNRKDEEEAAAMLVDRRRFCDAIVTDLPLLEGELRRKIQGSFCLFGVTSTATTDVSATPLDPQYVNIGVHANLIDQMLRSDYILRPPWARVDMWILLAYLTLVPLVLPAISIRKGFFAVALLVLCHMAFSSHMLIYRAIWIDATTPVLSLFTAYTLITIRRYLMEERAKNHIRGMFSTYLDPRVVELMLVDDRAYKDLGGTTREITAFFSDIEGFTTISELLDPDELSLMLQAYLTPMTDIILSHSGLRDKYIGDAIVGIFGAPYPSSDHAAQACLASIEQLERLATLKAEWIAAGVGWYRKAREARLDLNFRIGLNTGRAKVGNFGAEHAKNYTMIGDTVNLAARLEGANKAYKSRIMISETTFAAARTVIEARELDLLRVVGKIHPVMVYEVLGRRGAVDPARLALASAFSEALALYRARHFDQARGRFADLSRQHPDDAPTRVYLKRLEDTAYLASLPPDWDGAFSSKEK